MDRSSYELNVSFDGYEIEPATITQLKRHGAGKAASGSLTVTRAFDGMFRGNTSARIDGFIKTRDVEIEETDEWSYGFKLDRTTPRAEFKLAMDEAIGNLFTDCAVLILDDSGHSVRSSGLDGLDLTMRIRLPESVDSASYTLKVVGGFALKEDMADWGFELEEKYFLANPISGSARRVGGGDLNLYCGVQTEIKIKFTDVWPDPPEGLAPFGAVRFLDTNTTDKLPGDDNGRLVLEVPIQVDQ